MRAGVTGGVALPGVRRKAEAGRPSSRSKLNGTDRDGREHGYGPRPGGPSAGDTPPPAAFVPVAPAGSPA